ncbi:hypothetical protein [Aurantiacibacter luteus]|uniref:Uncharacterized protein n=1 Tax=Aurantiacibacter luteus TaxID=1581420 RepID=A0A0G9MNP7_9SPHN|nr:hypothetical protein [Aurantiacibacter luteus]KLE32330.1 hypothetical protein AAW00_12760 [Aurantiacibacter luteus]
MRDPHIAAKTLFYRSDMVVKALRQQLQREPDTLFKRRVGSFAKSIAISILPVTSTHRSACLRIFVSEVPVSDQGM